MKTVPHMFAELTAQTEDFHSLTVEGQRRDNSPDMQRAIASHMQMAMAAMDGIVGQIKQQLGDAHD